jgi:hypothetical protein
MTTFKDDLLTDRDIFLDDDEFAEEFVFSRSGATIKCIFNNAFVVVLDDVESTAPAIEAVKDSDITGIIHGDTLTRVSTGIVYKVTGVQPDGTGMTMVLLSQG